MNCDKIKFTAQINKPNINKLLIIIICLVAILICATSTASATTTNISSQNSSNIDHYSNLSNSNKINSNSINKNSVSQDIPEKTANIKITNGYKDAYKPGYPNPGNSINKSNYCNWVWININLTNNGPDDTNVTIKDNASNGLIYYNPSIGWIGYVRFNNGTGWTWDNNFNVTTGLGTYSIPNGATYQIAILGYVNQTGNIINNVTEISQDSYSPDPYPSVNSSLTIPKAAMIKVKQDFRTTLNGSPINTGNYHDWVYAVTTTTNNGPDASNVKYKNTHSGFTPNGVYYVSTDNGITWVKNDKSYNNTTSLWSINLKSNAIYLLAIYGQITQTANINDTTVETSQDVYNPYGPDNTLPKCLIVFDDGNAAQYNIAFKYMQSKGIIGTDYVNGYNIGQDNVETLKNLQEMNNAGWIIANHTYDHDILPELTDQEIINELSEQINFLINNGMPKGAYDLAYPGGYSDLNTYAVMEELNIQTGRTTIGNLINNLNALNLYQIPAYTILNTTTVSTVESYVNSAMNSDSTVVILFHDITYSNPTEYQYLTSNFQNIIDYIANSGIDCITIDDLYREASNAPINIPSSGVEFNNLSNSNGYASDTSFIEPTADIQINNTASNYSPNYNDDITLTITAKNNGPNNAENVEIGEWLDGNDLIWISDDSNGQYNTKTGDWEIGTLKNGESKTIHIVAHIISTDSTIYNTATYDSGSTYDPYPDNNYQTVNLTIIPKPYATISGDFNSPLNVTIEMATPGTIYYTLDGSNPTIQSSKYENPILITNTTVLKYMGVDVTGNVSPIYSQTYIIDTVAPTAKANIKGGLYNTNQLVNLSMSEPGIIYYTLNGGNSTKYSNPINISSNTVLKFLAVDMAGNKSPTYSQTYNIDKVPPKVKTIDPTTNSIKIVTNKVINVTFSKNIQAGTMWIELKNSLGISMNITSTIKGNVLTINHALPLKNGVYVLALHTGSIKDLAGNVLSLFTSRFTVGIPLTVQSITIKNSVVNSQTNQIIKVLFNYPIKAGNMKIELKTTGGKVIPFSTNISGNSLNLVVKNLLKKGYKYDIIFNTGCITDLEGNYVCYYSRVIQF